MNLMMDFEFDYRQLMTHAQGHRPDTFHLLHEEMTLTRTPLQKYGYVEHLSAAVATV